MLLSQSLQVFFCFSLYILACLESIPYTVINCSENSNTKQEKLTKKQPWFHIQITKSELKSAASHLLNLSNLIL